jgi:hypothetical protein
MTPGDLAFLALLQVPAITLAAALAYLAHCTRTLGSYVMLLGAVISLTISIASNFMPQTKTPVFDAAGHEKGVMVSTVASAIWLSSARISAAPLLALGAVLLARQWKRTSINTPPNQRVERP